VEALPYVLVVDDEEGMGQVLTRWLAGWGYHAVAVRSADHSLAVMEALPAPIVITDIMMPVHDGIWLLEQIHARWPDTVMIVESGARDQQKVLAARKLGAVDFLAKPFGREMLFQALQRAAARIAQPAAGSTQARPSPQLPAA
jgi:DNA-binding NtrC family response regulator